MTSSYNEEFDKGKILISDSGNAILKEIQLSKQNNVIVIIVKLCHNLGFVTRHSFSNLTNILKLHIWPQFDITKKEILVSTFLVS